jgi:predicted ester cyclase
MNTRLDLLQRMARRSCTAVLAIVIGSLALACDSAPPPPPPAPPAPPVKTPEERVAFYQDCWKHFNDKNWNAFQECYTENATSESVDSVPPSVQGRTNIIADAKSRLAVFPDSRGELTLVLGNGSRVAGVALYTATNEGPMPTPDGKSMPATKKKIGLHVGHVVDLDATGSRATREAAYLDEGAMMAQLGMSKAPARKAMMPTGAAPTVVIARNTPTETSNIAAYRAWIDAINKKDMKAFGEALADDFVLIEMAQPADLKKKETVAIIQGYLKGFPDLSVSLSTVWAAGDYVVAEGRYTGTNTGDIPPLKLNKTGKKVALRYLEIGRFENGKLKEMWSFANMAAFAAQLGLK